MLIPDRLGPEKGHRAEERGVKADRRERATCPRARSAGSRGRWGVGGAVSKGEGAEVGLAEV